MWRCGRVALVAVWRCGGVAVWRCGGVALVAMWRCGGVAVWRWWRCGDVAVWWCGDVAVWRCGRAPGGGPIARWRTPANARGQFTPLYRMDCPVASALAEAVGRSTRPGMVNSALAQNADGEWAIRRSRDAAKRPMAASRPAPGRLTAARCPTAASRPAPGRLTAAKRPTSAASQVQQGAQTVAYPQVIPCNSASDSPTLLQRSASCREYPPPEPGTAENPA